MGRTAGFQPISSAISLLRPSITSSPSSIRPPGKPKVPSKRRCICCEDGEIKYGFNHMPFLCCFWWVRGWNLWIRTSSRIYGTYEFPFNLYIYIKKQNIIRQIFIRPLMTIPDLLWDSSELYVCTKLEIFYLCPLPLHP